MVQHQFIYIEIMIMLKLTLYSIDKIIMRQIMKGDNFN